MKNYWILVCLWGAGQLSAQSDVIYVNDIQIEGNRRTRDEIVLRELHFKEGDSIAVVELGKVLEESEQFIMNTGLFNQANISFKEWDGGSNCVSIVITLEESWYIYPIPVFELADRNFNVWWVEQGRSLQRLNFGMEFTHLNFTGRKDRLRLVAKYGYTRNYSLRYSLPYINKQQTIGLSGEVYYAQNREINYATIGNKQVFYRDADHFLYQRFRMDGGLSYRPGLRVVHNFLLGYRQNAIDLIVPQELNPDFFLNGRRLQRYFSAAYTFSYDNRDVRPYPMQGDYFFAALEKDGLGVFRDRNSLTLSTVYEHYLQLDPRWSLGARLRTKASLIRNPQPYSDNRALGFGRNNLHGYEYYIVDGLDMAFAKSTIRWQCFDHTINFGRVMPISAFRRMPVKMFLALNYDMGIVNDPYASPDNLLHNRLLWGGGLGLDFVLFYDKVFQLEYSANHLGETGLFLHFNLNI